MELLTSVQISEVQGHDLWYEDHDLNVTHLIISMSKLKLSVFYLLFNFSEALNQYITKPVCF